MNQGKKGKRDTEDETEGEALPFPFSPCDFRPTVLLAFSNCYAA